MTDTRQRLLDATAETLRTEGIAGLSARTVAARADVNQALVFYHFGTMSELIQAATRAAVDESVVFYREQFSRIGSLTELLRSAATCTTASCCTTSCAGWRPGSASTCGARVSAPAR